MSGRLLCLPLSISLCVVLLSLEKKRGEVTRIIGDQKATQIDTAPRPAGGTCAGVTGEQRSTNADEDSLLGGAVHAPSILTPPAGKTVRPAFLQQGRRRPPSPLSVHPPSQ
jgi:hypothetical protein